MIINFFQRLGNLFSAVGNLFMNLIIIATVLFLTVLTLVYFFT